MARVYRIESHYGTEYCNTAKEADRCKPGDEEPEAVIRVDAAGECNRLDRAVEEAERFSQTVLLLLFELRDICPTELIYKTDVGRRVSKILADNSLPPANAADRDGQRSYGV